MLIALWQTADLGLVRRGAGDPDRWIRQMGDRQYQALGQHQSAAGCRTRCRVGCVHGFDRATAAQDAFKALMALGFHKPGDVEKSSRILREPNPSLGR